MKTVHDYRETLERLLKQAHPRLASIDRAAFRNCFGAVAGYVDGTIFASCGRFGLALRLPPKTLEALFREPDVIPLKYFPNGRVKKEYAVLPSRMLRDPARLKDLVSRSVRYAAARALEAGRKRPVSARDRRNPP